MIKAALIEDPDLTSGYLDRAVFAHFFETAADCLPGTSDRTCNTLLGKNEIIRSGLGSLIQKKGGNPLGKGHEESTFNSGYHVGEVLRCQLVNEIFKIDIVFHKP